MLLCVKLQVINLGVAGHFRNNAFWHRQCHDSLRALKHDMKHSLTL